MKINFTNSGWSLRITWRGIDLEPISRREPTGTSGRLSKLLKKGRRETTE
jgi:hypothetical protein